MASQRYMTSGVSKVVFAPAVASKSTPLRAEITAGKVLTVPTTTDVVEGLVALEGFETTPSTIAVPDVASVVDFTIPGRTSLGEAGMTFYADQDPIVSNIKSSLTEGSSGFLIIMHVGDVPGEECEVWPIRIGAVNRSQVTSAAEAATYRVACAITGTPVKNAVIPAAT